METAIGLFWLFSAAASIALSFSRWPRRKSWLFLSGVLATYLMVAYATAAIKPTSPFGAAMISLSATHIDCSLVDLHPDGTISLRGPVVTSGLHISPRANLSQGKFDAGGSDVYDAVARACTKH